MRQKLPRFWNCCFELCRSLERFKREDFEFSILLAFSEITHFEGGGGGDSLIKVGKDVWQVQNLGWAQYPRKNLISLCLGKKVPKNLMMGQVFMTFRVPTGHFFTLIKYYTFLVKNYQKPNA